MENPYASPLAAGEREPDSSIVRIRSVARTFKIVGWLGAIFYTPIVITCLASLLITLIGYRRINSLAVLAGASAFNGAILALAILYVMTGRRIAKHDLTVRQRAVLLSCVMMIGFPIFTIVGIIKQLVRSGQLSLRARLPQALFAQTSLSNVLPTAIPS